MAAEGVRATEAAGALVRAGFFDTGAALAVGELPDLRPTLRMLRWAVGYYQEERGVMARALKLCKALARERRGRAP
jgi:hypothetical protein